MDKLQGSAGIWEQVPPFKLTNQHHPATERHWHTSTSTSYSTEAFIASCRVEWAWAMGNGRASVHSHKSVFVAKLEKYVRKQMATDDEVKWTGRISRQSVQQFGPKVPQWQHTHIQTQGTHADTETYTGTDIAWKCKDTYAAHSRIWA